MKTTANNPWRDLWKAGFRESCGPDNPATAQQIAESWEWWFRDCPDGSRILDIATGNGIVLVHAAASARKEQRSFELTGIDLADIDPPKQIVDFDDAVRNARFVGEVAAESLPFDAASFDVVTSQFGLEYARLDQALAEVTRVSTASGSLIWLAHSPASTVVEQYKAQDTEVDYLLASRGPVYFMKKLVERQRRHKDIKYSLDNLYAVFAEAEQYCRNNPPARIVREVCTEFSKAVNQLRRINVNDVERMIKFAEQRLFAHKNRIKSLSAAAMSPERLEQVERRLSELGWQNLNIDEMRVDSDTKPIGIRISATRA